MADKVGNRTLNTCIPRLHSEKTLKFDIDVLIAEMELGMWKFIE